MELVVNYITYLLTYSVLLTTNGGNLLLVQAYLMSNSFHLEYVYYVGHKNILFYRRFS